MNNKEFNIFIECIVEPYRDHIMNPYGKHVIQVCEINNRIHHMPLYNRFLVFRFEKRNIDIFIEFLGIILFYENHVAYQISKIRLSRLINGYTIRLDFING